MTTRDCRISLRVSRNNEDRVGESDLTIMSNNLNNNSHHYAIDAAKLVEKCRRLLHSILDVIESKSSIRAFQRQSYQLAALSDGKSCAHLFCCY